jgi:Double zinc ribbon
MVDELFEVFEDLFERRGKKSRKGKGSRGDDTPRSNGDRPPAPASPPLFCLECGVKNDAAGRFCQECGSLLPSPGEEMRCLKCNVVVPLTAKFCGRCGARVAPAITG